MISLSVSRRYHNVLSAKKNEYEYFLNYRLPNKKRELIFWELSLSVLTSAVDKGLDRKYDVYL